MRTSLLLATLLVSALSPMLVQGAESEIKILSPAEDATKKTVLIGRTAVDGMSITLEIEGAERMWMQMGMPPKWMEQPVAKGDIFHLEVKPVDPKSKTRISFAEVKFSAVNRDNKKTVSGAMHPSWGDSGLHYASNTPLSGDGSYDVTVTVGVPSFGRTEKTKDVWTKPVSAKFHFKLAGVKLVEVTKPAPEPK